MATLYAHNTKVVDDDAPRLAFVRHPVSYDLIGEYESKLDLPVHPNHPDMGVRRWNIGKGKIWLEGDDLGKMDVRLKEFADVALHDREARLESIERSDKRPIVHWLTDQNSTDGVLVGTKDDTNIHIEGKMERHKHAVGTIVQLERVGYARVMQDGSLMLCHEDLQDD